MGPAIGKDGEAKPAGSKAQGKQFGSIFGDASDQVEKAWSSGLRVLSDVRRLFSFRREYGRE